MSLPNSIIRNLAGGGVGSLVSLPRPARQIRITCTVGGVARVRAQVVPANGPFTTPTAPGADPLPNGGANSTAGWQNLASGDSWTSPLQIYGESYLPVEIWEATAGILTLEGVA